MAVPRFSFYNYKFYIMGLFDYFKKKKEEQKREKQRAEEAANHRKFEEERIVNEREKRLEENRQKEAELQARLKVEREQTLQIEPFIFKSNCHQRYENGQPKMGLQECFRTVCVDKNIDGCNGYKLESGVGYIVKVFNDDLGRPNMSDKPMKIVRKTENSVELRGFPIEAMSPFGWQEVDYSVYGFIVYYEHGKVSKCVLHMYDRNTFIEYRYVDKTPLMTANTNSSISECEQFAQQAQDAANIGNTSKAHQYGLKVYDSIIRDPLQLSKVSDIQSIALTLGKLMEGDFFSDNDSIKKAVGLIWA